MLKRHNHRLNAQIDLEFSSFYALKKNVPLIQPMIDFLLQQQQALMKFSFLHRHEILNHYHQWFDRLRFVEKPNHTIPTSNLAFAIKNYLHHQPIKQWGSDSEFEQDGFLLIRLIGFLALQRKNEKPFPLTKNPQFNRWEMFARLTHQHPRSLAAAYLYTYWIQALKSKRTRGTPIVQKQLFRNIVKASLKALAHHQEWSRQIPYFAQLFQSRKSSLLNLESMVEETLPNNHYVVDNLISIAFIVLKRKSAKHAIQLMQKYVPENMVVLMASIDLEQCLY
jgi:ADP-ribosylglycohydrolase